MQWYRLSQKINTDIMRDAFYRMAGVILVYSLD